MIQKLERVVRRLQFLRPVADRVLQAPAGFVGLLAMLLQFRRHLVEMARHHFEFVARCKVDAVFQRTGLQGPRALQQQFQGALEAPAQMQCPQHGRDKGDDRHGNRLLPQPVQAPLGCGTGNGNRLALPFDGTVEQLAKIPALGHVEDLRHLPPDIREFRAGRQRLQVLQLRLHLEDVAVQQLADLDQLEDLLRHGDVLPRGHLPPRVQVQAGHGIQPPGTGSHSLEQLIADRRGRLCIHEALRSPHTQPLLVG